MSNWFEQATNYQRAYRAYTKVKNSPTPWSLKVSYQQWQQKPEFYLLELLESLRLGNYRPDPVNSFAIAKSNGKKRVLQAQMLKDKVVQKMVADFLVEQIDPHFAEQSYAYRPRRSVDMAIHRARQLIATDLNWLVQADIKHCFDAIPQKPLNKVLKQWVPDRKLQQLFDLWLAQYAHSSSLLGSRVGIMQGAVISPLWCNLYLHQLDKLLLKANINFIRFADNILLFTSSSGGAERAQKVLVRGLSGLGLELNGEKTQCCEVHRGVRYLGQPLLKMNR